MPIYSFFSVALCVNMCECEQADGGSAVFSFSTLTEERRGTCTGSIIAFICSTRARQAGANFGFLECGLLEDTTCFVFREAFRTES